MQRCARLEQGRVQVQKIVSQIGGGDLPVSLPQVTKDILIERWTVLEGIAEPLARMAGLAGRWGDGSEFGQMEDSLRALVSARGGNGNVALLGLTTYPAYLLANTQANASFGSKAASD